MAKKHTTMAAAAPDPFGNATTVAESIVSQMMEGEEEKVQPISTAPVPRTSTVPVTKRATNRTSDMANERATSGAAAGCKPGMARQSYVLPVDLPGKIKSLAGHLGIPASTLAAEILEQGVAEREKEFWELVSKRH